MRRVNASVKAELLARIEAAGVVGAGGSGYPTHLKLRVACDTVIANGAECEPLLEKDLHVMLRRTEAVLDGLARAAELVGARRRVVAVKRKRVELVAALRRAADRRGRMEVVELDDVYPSGDEFVLVHDLTGRRPPPGGHPTDVGVLVQNVETLANLAAALDGAPVTATWLTVCGAVREPYTAAVPLGTTAGDLLARAGGFTGGASAAHDDWAALEGGAMMGRLVLDRDHPATKTTAALLFLPRDHRAVSRTAEPESRKRAVGRAACDQCSYCTQFCPRYLLGYAVEPHRVMRGLGFGTDRAAERDPWGLLCCECGVCDLYACPEDLAPRDACRWSKRAAGQKSAVGPPPDAGAAHPLRAGRLVPLSMLKLRLDLRRYDRPAPWCELTPGPDTVIVPHRQHAGVAGRPRLVAGAVVTVGELLADVSPGALGAPVHAPIDGRVAAVTTDATTLVRGR